MLANVQRFITRSLKGIREGDNEKTKLNLMVSLSWFMSILNRLHIDIENEVWKRFSYFCSYCASCPCVCKAQKIQTRQPITINEQKRPKTIADFQKMFGQIYPASQRTLDHAGVHLVEEMGEVAEAILNYRGNHNDQDFKAVILESADLISCAMGVFNSLGVDLVRDLSVVFANNCHECKQAPCMCSFAHII